MIEFITYVCRLNPYKSITTIKTPHKDLSKRPIRFSLFYSLKNLNTRFLSYLSEFWSSFVDNISQVVMSKAQKSQHRLWPPFSILFSNQPLALRLDGGYHETSDGKRISGFRNTIGVLSNRFFNNWWWKQGFIFHK